MAMAATTAKTDTLSTPPEEKVVERVDYLNLPCPIPYEEIHREALSKCYSGNFLCCLLGDSFTMSATSSAVD